MLNVGSQSYTKRAFARNMLLVLMFVCYLFVSDMFMGRMFLRPAGFGLPVTHCILIIGFALYAVCSMAYLLNTARNVPLYYAAQVEQVLSFGDHLCCCLLYSSIA